MIKLVLQILASLTLLGQLICAGLLILAVMKRSQKKKHEVIAFIESNGVYGLLIVTLVATLGSLFFSEVAKFQPCILCWYQRILMYPQPILLYTGILRREFVLRPYLIVLNIIGLCIALYHYTIQVLPHTLPVPCVAGDISCVRGYTFYYGYITIPLMAATAFALNVALLSFVQSKKHA